MVAHGYDRRSGGFGVQAFDEPDEVLQEDFTELEIAEYTVFLFALDTYLRYLAETNGNDEPDAVAHRGLRLTRLVEGLHSETIRAFFDANIQNPTLQRMVSRGFNLRPSSEGVSRRALQLRTALSRGGTAAMRAVFKSQKALLAVRAAINAAMVEDADVALDKFAVITLRNARLRDWIDLAAKTAGSGTPPGAVSAATSGVGETATQVVEHSMLSAGQTGSVASVQATEARDKLLQKVQAEAKATAVKALDQAQQVDDVPTRSEVVAIATAAAVAATSDPTNNRNVPPSLALLSDENRAVALMGGRVRVAAGAGAGKSTTLCARVDYLVREKGVDPSKILVVAFNKKASDELKAKIAKGTGAQAADKMTIGTMHKVFKDFILRYGSPTERAMFLVRAPDKKNPGQYKMEVRAVKDNQIIRPILNAWKKCFPPPGEGVPFPETQLWKNVPKPKRMRAYLNKFQGAGWTVKQAQDWARASREQEHIQAALFFEFYEGFKGALGRDWAPRACPNITQTAEFTGFVTRVRGGSARCGDFADMLTTIRNIVRDNPQAKSALQAQYDHIFVDECQDLNPVQTETFMMLADDISVDDEKQGVWLVGDDKQCAHVDTPISTPKGPRRAGDLRAGDEVLAYRNGLITPQRVTHVAESKWDHGIKVTTESGKSLTISPNHKIWASSPELGEGQKIVYLMYRQDLGFRVGITNKCEAKWNPFGSRTSTEQAEKLWILALADDKESALYMESHFSLKYGIPTSVFNGETRGINQVRLNKLFAEFGRNGARLLEDMHLSFDLPNWVSTSYSKHGTVRRTIQMVAHAAGGTLVNLEWTGRDLDGVLGDAGFTRLANDRNRIRRWFRSYRQALAFAEELKRKAGANLHRRISTVDEPFPLITAGGLVPGMSVLVEDGESVVAEKIVSVENVPGSFVDLDVDDASNFFGGGILSHNSIYMFRGAAPEQFRNLDQQGFKTGFMRTNRRCMPEIVEAANRLIAHNQNQIPMEASPLPEKARGVASIVVSIPDTNAGAAVDFANRVKEAQIDGEKVEKYAVLTRTNKELHDFETACIIRGVPYVRKGASSFLGAPEAKTFLSFVEAVTSNDTDRLVPAFAEILFATRRLRGIKGKPENIEDAIWTAIGRYASYKGVDRKTVNPIGAALTDGGFRVMLAQALAGRQLSDFIAGKDANVIADLVGEIAEMRTKAAEARKYQYTTENMFDEILAFKCVERSPNEAGVWVEEEKTLKDKLVMQLAFSSDDEDADTADDAEEGDGGENLGAIAFFKEMLKPDPTETNLDPTNPIDFRLRIERYRQRSKELRIDPNEWEKKNPGVKPPGVYLGTVHSTKGAEWEDVTVMMPYGVFPYVPFPRRESASECPEVPLFSEEEESEAERRLAYVAFTRAAKNLTIACPYEAVANRRPKGAPAPPRSAAITQYVREAGLVEGENVKPPAATGPSLNAVGAQAVSVAEIAPEEDIPTPIEGDGEDAGAVKIAGYDRRVVAFVPCECGDDPFGPADEDPTDTWRE